MCISRANTLSNYCLERLVGPSVCDTEEIDLPKTPRPSRAPVAEQGLGVALEVEGKRKTSIFDPELGKMPATSRSTARRTCESAI